MEELQSPLHCYKCYCAVKAHFKFGSTYDFVAKKGRTTAGISSFNKRHDQYFFRLLASRYDEKQIVPFFVAQFIEDPNCYLTTMCFEAEIAERHYKSFMHRHRTLLDNFKIDIRRLTTEYAQADNVHSWRGILLGKDKNDLPLIYRCLVQGKITPETITILDQIFGYLDKMCPDDVFLQQHVFKYKKYWSFIGLSEEGLNIMKKYIPKKIS